MSDIAIIVLLVVTMIVAMIGLPVIFMRRAIPAVIRIFREHNAIKANAAKTPDELGFKSRTILERMWKPRDYKTQALQLLRNADIIKMTEDGKLYLSEEDLMSSRWRGY